MMKYVVIIIGAWFVWRYFIAGRKLFGKELEVVVPLLVLAAIAFYIIFINDPVPQRYDPAYEEEMDILDAYWGR